MSIARTVRKTWDRNLLFSALVELTYRCNLDCFFCYNDLTLRGQPMSKQDYFRFFEDLARMQVLHLTLTGGEPLAHPDFLPIGRKARQLGFVIRIKSNGHVFGGERARRIKEEIDPYAVEVSLHGARAATHDRQTRVPGSFERLMANLRQMLDLGLRVQINSTLTLWNENEIEEMMAIADDLGVRLQIDPEVTPRDNGDRSPLTIAPSRQGMERLLRLQLERARRQPAEPSLVQRESDTAPAPAPSDKHCGVGSSAVAVDPYGNVYPCVQWRQPVGNLHQQSIEEIWHGSAVLTEVRREAGRAKEMVDRHGPHGAAMGFCPGSARQQTGSATGLYDAAKQRMSVFRQVAAGGNSRLPVLQ